MNIAENPEVSDQSVPKREECCASPLDLLSCWLEGKEVPTVCSRKAHSGKTLIAFCNQVKNVASICTEGLMYEIDVTGKLGMSRFTLTKRASEREIWLKLRGNYRLVVLVPYVSIELMNNSFECREFHSVCEIFTMGINSAPDPAMIGKSVSGGVKAVSITK